MAPTTNGPATPLPDMGNVFKTSPNAQVMTDLLIEYRNRARVHLQETMPNKITHLQELIAKENDSSSPLWPGHVEHFHPVLLQPEAMTEGPKPITPDDIIRSKHDSAIEAGDYMDDDPKKGVRVGPHWFEVVPKNEIQSKLIDMSLKEHEDLHIIVQDLKVWLELEIPLIEDGNSFGAEVQNALIRDLTEICKRSNGFQNGARTHYLDRLKLAQDWVKFPNLMDFPAAIAISDRHDHVLLRSYLRSILTIYGGLMTKFERNWEKVINPKGASSRGGMY